MKDERDSYKNIEEVALKISRLEKELLQGKNEQENQKKIEQIMDSLSLDEILLMDDYIESYHLIQ